ncbi:uncharacterized protein LOC128128384 isoform X1 [Lactuca sativa]|nr:uncharacterized protein LOC111895505 isoform X1 [Lactuca sativa]XP_052623151.1 uncharacterized protein LOC111895505 isoform X1 [Lactuca sativa]XP_052623152.1 uncharacterized protein LOC111895505 isoform X1 [Lactuca sativa]XP_052623154.1 uncharacterized protein LOC128128384 isoform X1 [Lactuca sativa]XP_052623155.1 uncharacterized protein LOC128128384 isoform X1 [Lactuca sativa]XP_052623156.1 uncharacterized protein LOC128128384 isoform X1 [Lactuca sativa]KAJ0187482.1 hypothetical protein L
MDGEKKTGSGNEPQDMDQDQGHHIGSSVDSLGLLANNIKKIMNDIESMSNTLKGLDTSAHTIEERFKRYFLLPKPKPEPVEQKKSGDGPNKVEIWRKVLLPSFPEKFDDLQGFCKWIDSVENSFGCFPLSGVDKAKLVFNTLPQEGEAFRWWQGIQNLSMQVDKRPFTWDEMKLLFMAEFVSPEFLVPNKKSKTSL